MRVLTTLLISIFIAFAARAGTLPSLRVPTNNPVTADKALLGRYLFYDKRLSVNGTTSCASCHRQDLAFTDGRACAVGATGESHPRSAMSLVNVAYNEAFNWSDPSVHSLEEQALKPMFSTRPIELGVVKEALIRLIGSDTTYRPLFRRAFPGESDPYTIQNVAKAIATFERTIVSVDSPYDRYHLDGDENAISESAKRGEILFFLDPGPGCFQCHHGLNFTDSAKLHNTGLYNLARTFSYPAPNRGLYESTKRPADIGKFRAPTLRNIALTAPYMHDGSVATLDAVLDHYAAGGRTVASGPLAGIGHDNPAKDKRIRGFNLSPQNRVDLIEFLKSLTSDNVLHDPRFADPWPSNQSESR